MIIVGGTYNEFCFEPRWEEKFGSGLRACRVINTIDPKIDIEFNTFGDKDTKLYLEQISSVFPKIKSNVSDIKESISFYYDHPLITPRIFPRLDTINKYLLSVFLQTGITNDACLIFCLFWEKKLGSRREPFGHFLPVL